MRRPTHKDPEWDSFFGDQHRMLDDMHDMLYRASESMSGHTETTTTKTHTEVVYRITAQNGRMRWRLFWRFARSAFGVLFRGRTTFRMVTNNLNVKTK